MKKLLAALLALAMLLSCVCAVAEDKPLSGKTISFWMQAYGGDTARQTAMLDELTKAFYDETGITVNASIVDWGNAHAKYSLAATGGEAPDVADTFFAYTWHAIGGEEYGLMAIDDVVEEIGGSDNWYRFADPECFIDGHWRGLPWRGDTRTAIYNTEMFAAAGITEFPKTYEELVDVAQKLTTYHEDGTIDVAGMVWFSDKGCFHQSFFAALAGMGGSMMNEDFTEWKLDSAETREALHFMQDNFYQHKVFSNTVLDPSFAPVDSFAAGKAAIVLGVTPDTLVTLQNNAPQIAAVTKNAVMPSKTGVENSTIAFAAPVVIFNSTKEPEAAKEWLRFLFRTENQVAMMKGTACISVWKNVMADEYFQTEWYNTVLAQNERANAGDMPLTNWGIFDASPDGPINEMCAAVMAGGDVDEAIATCWAAFEEIMAE